MKHSRMSSPIFPALSTTSITHGGYLPRSATSAPRSSRITTLGRWSKPPRDPVQLYGRTPFRGQFRAPVCPGVNQHGTWVWLSPEHIIIRLTFQDDEWPTTQVLSIGFNINSGARNPARGRALDLYRRRG